MPETLVLCAQLALESATEQAGQFTARNCGLALQESYVVTKDWQIESEIISAAKPP